MVRRIGKALRSTREVEVEVEIDLDGGEVAIETPIKFLNHMLETLALFSGSGMSVKARGDLNHHIVEDTAIAIGEALSKALGDRKGINRFGYAIIPMDEALILASIDLVRRPYIESDLDLDRVVIEDLEGGLIDHFYRTLAYNVPLTLHIVKLRGKDPHHIAEASFKSLGLALMQAWSRIDQDRGSKILSVKGRL